MKRVRTVSSHLVIAMASIVQVRSAAWHVRLIPALFGPEAEPEPVVAT
ncbi:MAG: hypothetical protein V3571_00230 [Pseudodesulfovibrio sp.]